MVNKILIYALHTFYIVYYISQMTNVSSCDPSYYKRSITHDHILTNTLGALFPSPRFKYHMFFTLVSVRQSIHLSILFNIHFLPARACSPFFSHHPQLHI